MSKKIVIEKANWIDSVFFNFMSSPHNWQRRAESINHIACLTIDEVEKQLKDKKQDILEFKFDLAYVALFLCSISLENLIKGLYILRNENCCSNGELPKILTTHNILSIAEKANIKLKEEERELCDFAGHVILWWGKYPVPKRYDQIFGGLSFEHSIFDTYKSLYKKCQNDLKRKR